MASTINASTTLGLISTADTSGVLQLQTANTTAVTVSATQNVGIGTASPSSRLEVAGDASPIVRITSTSGPYSQIQSNTVGTLQLMADEGNTGASTSIRFRVDAAEVARFDSAGNLGLGVTPSAWDSAFDAFQLNTTGCIASTSNRTFVGQNWYDAAAGGKHLANGFALRYDQIGSNGSHAWYTSTSGTAGNAISFTQAMTLDADGDLGIGTTSPATRLEVAAASPIVRITDTTSAVAGGTYGALEWKTSDVSAPSGGIVGKIDVYDDVGIYGDRGAMRFYTNDSASIGERARITSAGNLLVGKTAVGDATAGAHISANGRGGFVRSSGDPLYINRLTDDGTLVTFDQATVTEGSISVSGTTVSYNGGHLSRWAQMLTNPELFKGTVMSNLDEMNVYTKDGQPVDNEQLNKVKVSDIEGDANVAGVFVNWTHDDAHNVDEINMAMTGDMIIRIAQGVTVVRGDLLMSAGDGTAKPQGDDIIRSKTVAKVTSNHVTCTYADGSYCVPCVLMAC